MIGDGARMPRLKVQSGARRSHQSSPYRGYDRQAAGVGGLKVGSMDNDKRRRDDLRIVLLEVVSCHCGRSEKKE